jgi:hypothetical protein
VGFSSTAGACFSMSSPAWRMGDWVNAEGTVVFDLVQPVVAG